MAKTMAIIIFLIILIIIKPLEIINISGVKAVSDEDLIATNCLNVPASVFIDTLKNSMEGVVKVASIVSKFTGFISDFRVSNAVADCLDLLELSSDELSWTLSASQFGNSFYSFFTALHFYFLFLKFRSFFNEIISIRLIYVYLIG